MAVTSTTRDGIAVITFDNPPVSGLGLDIRRGLAEALDAANADDTVAGIVITGGGRVFSGGADIKEFGTPRAAAEPTLSTVRARTTTARAQAASSRGSPYRLPSRSRPRQLR